MLYAISSLASSSDRLGLYLYSVVSYYRGIAYTFNLYTSSDSTVSDYSNRAWGMIDNNNIRMDGMDQRLRRIYYVMMYFSVGNGRRRGLVINLGLYQALVPDRFF